MKIGGSRPGGSPGPTEYSITRATSYKYIQGEKEKMRQDFEKAEGGKCLKRSQKDRVRRKKDAEQYGTGKITDK